MVCQPPNCGFMPPSVRWIYAEPLQLATKGHSPAVLALPGPWRQQGPIIFDATFLLPNSQGSPGSPCRFPRLESCEPCAAFLVSRPTPSGCGCSPPTDCITAAPAGGA